MRELDELENYFKEYWLNEKAYLVMPNTARAKLYLKEIVKDISIKGILDNDNKLNKTYYNNIPVFHALEYFNTNKKCKILISNHYKEISSQLNELGYKENIDYIDMHKFVSAWYWINKKEIHILDIHIAVTTFCSLNCKNCNMFISCYEKEQKRHLEIQEFKENINNLFRVINYCYRITIVGGEPLLNPELYKMIKWLEETYRDQFGIIEIVTNGTIIPKQELIDVCRKKNIRFAISDYGEQISLVQNIGELIDILEKENIEYEQKKEMKWKNFYFPREKQKVKMNTIREHMLMCNPIFRGINDNKFYYCHIVWSAVQAGLLPEKESDSIDISGTLNEEERRNLMAYDLGIMRNGYVSLCEYCGGCGEDNLEIIPAGVQETCCIENAYQQEVK